MVGSFVRGCAWPGGAGVAYPRADPADFSRLPIDTWATAQLPVGVRLEFVGDAEAVEIRYHTNTGDLAYRGHDTSHAFSVWQGEKKVAEVAAQPGSATAVLPLAETASNADEASIVYLPPGLQPVVESIKPRGGVIEPAPPRPKWLVYGDSIA